MKKTSQLVCQHLENISRDALEKFQDTIRDYVRGRQGVYALYRRNRLYYVGLASDLRWRLNAHLKDRHGERWDRFSVYFTVGATHLREMESLLLRVAKPKGNKQKGRFANSENMGRLFGREVRRLQRNEYLLLMGRAPLRKTNAALAGTPDRKVPLSKYVKRPIKIRAIYKGTIHSAHVHSTGIIEFAGRFYPTPSRAGHAVTRRSTNGWWFWKYERAPGDWVRLDELRK
jgi:Restriction Enzyme Adenine Methylase Associated